MANAVRTVLLSEPARTELRRRVRAEGLPAREVERARIVLLAAEGLSGVQIAERVGCSEPTVIRWRSRFAEQGLSGLADEPRSGKPATIPQTVRDEILAITLTKPPAELGITQWSSRLLADRLRRDGRPVSHASVARVWKAFGIQPHRFGTFKFSTDPLLEAKIRDIVGLYLDPPERAVVLCVDEKSQIQALDRTAPILPLRPGLPATRTHDYVRHGTTTLFAALEVATGRVTDARFPRHRHQEFLTFLRQVAKAYPRRRLHVVVDNYGSHKHPKVNAWLAKNPRVTLHFTPTSGSWLNLVEVFFGIITRQALRRGTFASVADLETAIGTYIDAWNERCQPFIWTKDADTILAKATRQQRETTR
ncbi:IS630 family transposase [Kineosporia sp. A_224]|uniref:IS630 family transposase n=1 Tax=Kineosporia sp. A_224 TaxID=1962180 RepID=UPI00117B9BF4|nr:IS630 family transposase [Kineosporia sp. A_224]